MHRTVTPGEYALALLPHVELPSTVSMTPVSGMQEVVGPV